jgi:P27 family predicted phage terminase small subunit
MGKRFRRLVPEHLDDEARRKWAELCPVLERRGDMDQGTADALAAYATAWSRWVAAEKKVAELGPVIKSAQGFAQENPYLTIARKSQIAMRQWLDKLKG